ncbi:MAG TPA: hypothetical protein VKT77_01325, partial [Chthonomonadaceae bacterium]|nr:hypothetical protein [Chthonomonadaceae bacterium]
MRRKLAGKRPSGPPDPNSPRGGGTVRQSVRLDGARAEYAGAGGTAGRLRATRPRISAVIIAAIGCVLIAVNDRTVRIERNYYPMLMLFGPVCVLYGLAGAIDPKTLNPGALPDGRSKTLYRSLLAAVVAAG